MLFNYLKTAIRNIQRNVLFSLISILGLAVGMAACLLILHYVQFERSYDTFHKDSGRIYRLRYERATEDGQKVQFASCCPPAADVIRGAYPEVEEIGRIYPHPAVVTPENRDVQFMEERMYFAEPEFFKIFDFPFIEGDPIDGIRPASTAFISRSTAERYFGQEESVGKSFTVDGKTDYRITGVFKDIPPNSHLKFDVLLSYQNLYAIRSPEVLQSWGYTLFYTYLRLSPDADLSKFNSELSRLVDTHAGELMRVYKVYIELIMQPLEDIHLTSHFMQEYETNGSLTSTKILLLVAFFIILMAWINHINLSTSRSLTRAKEVGLRKVIGASRVQILIQFFLETFIVFLSAAVLALVIINMFLSNFIRITGIPPQFNPWESSWFWISLLIFLLTGIILSGSYPVAALSGFRPAAVLRDKLGSRPKGLNLRKVLVVVQFLIAFILITATFSVYGQIQHMKNQDLGFDIERVAVIDMPRIRSDSFQPSVDTFREELLKNPVVQGMCVVTEVPGKQILWDNGGIRRAGEDPGKGKNYQIVGIDYDFVDVFKIDILYGRNFSKEFPADEKALIFNQTAVKWMGFANAEAAIGQEVDYWGEIYHIIGVIRDYHQQSLKEAFEPHIYRLYPYGRPPFGLFAVKIGLENVQDTLALIERQYKTSFPGNPFALFFLDKYYERQYLSDELFGRILGIFSLLALFVTCLGIFGMSSFMAVQRTKEIGIRKVLGASTGSILKLLMKDFFLLAGLSVLMALPVAYWVVRQWLNSFASRMSLNVLLFVVPLLIILSVTVLTTSANVFKASRANPVDSLKHE
jgi:putative ABC transport system permease protein